MKNNILKIMLLFFITMFIAGCNKNNFEIGKESDVVVDNTKVTLSIKKNSLTKTGVTLVLKNTTEKDIEYGNPYEIEILKDNKWHKINIQIDFNLQAYVLKPNESKELIINWKETYGKLQSGKYRIIKSISVEQKNNTFDSFNISQEFEIK